MHAAALSTHALSAHYKAECFSVITYMSGCPSNIGSQQDRWQPPLKKGVAAEGLNCPSEMFERMYINV